MANQKFFKGSAKIIMNRSIAYLGPAGTYSEAAAMAYVNQQSETIAAECSLRPYATIAQTLRAVAEARFLAFPSFLPPQLIPPLLRRI